MRTAATSSPSAVSLWWWDVGVTWGCSTLTRGLLPRGLAVLCVLPGMSPLGRWLVPEGELFWQESGSLRSSLCARNRLTHVRRMLAVHTVT